MSIPLDRLYEYIENLSNEVHGDNVLIYRFYPHGSKKLEDLGWLKFYPDILPPEAIPTAVDIYCHDQEPLDYNAYDVDPVDTGFLKVAQRFNLETEPAFKTNLRIADYFNIHDRCLLVHSELNSPEVEKYQSDMRFVPVYYWSHALIARDWFRFAKHDNKLEQRNPTHDFLIYNRAWEGTREYRVKFIENLYLNGLANYCRTTFNTVDPSLGVHYRDHEFETIAWKPITNIDGIFPENDYDSHYSADYTAEDYIDTRWEIVLETLFDDPRIYLTEKSLRPIACRQPFILMAPAGSLQYLKDYGFKTFDSIIDESYDAIEHPVKRMEAVIAQMRIIAGWTQQEKEDNLKKIDSVLAHNQRLFFSDVFWNYVVDEFKRNLKIGLDEIKQTNTSARFLEHRKYCAQFPKWREFMTTDLPGKRRQRLHTTDILKCAREYYNRAGKPTATDSWSSYGRTIPASDLDPE